MTEDELIEIYNHEMEEAKARGGKNAEDAVQRVFLKLWEKLDEYSHIPKEEMMRYFRVAKKRDIADLGKSDKKWLGEQFGDLDSIRIGEHRLSHSRDTKRDSATIVRKGLEEIRQRDERIDVERAKASLNSEDRDRIERYHDRAPKDRVTLHSLGREQGISHSTVQRKIKRAENTLRERLSPYGERYSSHKREHSSDEGTSAA